MLADLARRGVNELHVEAGHKLNASLLREGLVDELLVYLAPKLLGIGREMAAFGPLSTLAEALRFEFTQVDRIGDDLRILARPPGRADFLRQLSACSPASSPASASIVEAAAPPIQASA